MKTDLSPAKQALLEKWMQGQFSNDVPTIPLRPPNSPIPLSFPQQRQLFLELLEPGTAVNNLSTLLRLNGHLDITALEQSVNQIIARQEVLRTRFSFGPSLPTPEVLPGLMINVPIIDLQEVDVEEQMSEVYRLAENEVLQPFDLAKAPLIRLTLYVVSREQHVLLVVVHHTISDGWSLGVFLRELIQYYQQIAIGKFHPLPELPIQYADYAYWQNQTSQGETFQSAMRYWKKQLSGDLPVLELPTDQQRGPRQTFSGGTHRFVLSTDLTAALEKLSREEDVTMFMTMMTAFFILLHRYSGQDDILVGTPIANRNLPELENLVGVFINTLVIRTSLDDDPGFRALLRRVRDVALEAYAHQDLPFEKLVEALKPQRDLSRTPVFQVVFNLQNSPLPDLEIPGLDLGFLEIDRGVSQFDLTLMMTASEGQYRGTVEYNRELFTPATIDRMFRSFQMLLGHAIVNPDDAISKMPLIANDELHHLVDELNRTVLDYPRNKCVHQLFEAQVGETPNAVAIRYDQTSITYLELNRRATVVAAHLLSLGVGPCVRVGIYMEKSLAIVEVLLGVLKAGGTYVPIHTSFPPARVQYILEDADAKVLVTNVDPLLVETLHVQVVHWHDDQMSTVNGVAPQAIHITPDHLAYIIYTSGSTGQPKGVMVQHSALVNFLWSMRNQPGISKKDVLLTVTSIAFDIAALELFLPLIAGATVVIPTKEMAANPFLLGRAIHQYQVNMMQATPATWQILLDSGWAGEPGLKALCGGDVLTRKLADQLLDGVDSLWNMYGPTETTIWSSLSSIQKGDHPISIGQPIANTQLYVLDRYLQPVPVGVIGELHIGGEGLALGYLNQAGLTKEKFIHDVFSKKPGARLYKTGDRARYLPGGSMVVIGRIDEQVKIHGHRIELGEIVAVMMQYPGVQEAIVITRTETSGEKRLVAYVVPAHDQSPDIDELVNFARKKLPAYMIPAVFVFVDHVPLTSNGKIDRKLLPVPEGTQPLRGYRAPRNEAEQIFATLWQEALDIEQVGIDDNFFDLGGASIQSLEIVAKANMFGFPLTVEAIFEHQTIAALVAQMKRA